LPFLFSGDELADMTVHQSLEPVKGHSWWG